MAAPGVVAPILGAHHGIRGVESVKNIALPPFDGENWFLYSMRVEGELEAADMWDVMNGSEARPAAAGDAQTIWDKKSRVCRAALLRSLTNDQLNLVSVHRLAPEMWQALQSCYAVETETKRDALFEQILQFAPMEQSETMFNHVGKFQALNSQYASAVAAENAALGLPAGTPAGLRDNQKRSILIRSLPPEYLPCVQIMRTQKLTYAQFIAALLEEAEVRPTDRSRGGSDDSAKALKAGQRGKGSSNFTCFNCNKPGHRASDCRSPKSDDVPSKKPSKPRRGGPKPVGGGGGVTCNYCGKGGHIQPKCTHYLKSRADFKEAESSGHAHKATGDVAKVTKVMMTRKTSDTGG